MEFQEQSENDGISSSSKILVMEEWNGSSSSKLSRTTVLTLTPSSFSLQRYGNRFSEVSTRIIEAFVPEGFPTSVTPDYAPFQVWDFVQVGHGWISILKVTLGRLAAQVDRMENRAALRSSC